MEPGRDELTARRDRAGDGIVRPYREMPLPAALRIPRPLSALLGAAVAAGPVVALAGRRQPRRRRVLRAVTATSSLGYLITALADLAEHFRLEREVTGHMLRWTAIPPLEALTHAGIIATNLSLLLFAQPLRNGRRLRDRWFLIAPAAFLALGWADELGFHRRRTMHREDLIHTTQHLAEGIMWTAVYATRIFGARPPRRVFVR